MKTKKPPGHGSIRHFDLSEHHGHRDDHGFTCGAEFDVRIRRGVQIPDFARARLSSVQLDSIWWQFADHYRVELEDALRKRYRWIGRTSFVGRGPGWLAIEDTACGKRNWDTIAKSVERSLKTFVGLMESEDFWKEELVG